MYRYGLLYAISESLRIVCFIAVCVMEQSELSIFLTSQSATKRPTTPSHRIRMSTFVDVGRNFVGIKKKKKYLFKYFVTIPFKKSDKYNKMR